MRLSGIWCAFMVLIVIALIVQFETVEGRRKSGKKKKDKAGVCKYRKSGESACDTTSNTKTIELSLKKGDTATCPATKTVSKPCGHTDDDSPTKKKIKGCKYEKKNAQWGDCDSSQMKSKVMKLKEGSKPECPPTNIRKKSCKEKKGNRRAKLGPP
uniref:Pleiotrophin/Midkine C-terminal domain-containing protein n=1 Tax=Arion vulgaris TaxID=1028688 RepID=A0A0B7ACJ1_9EUPU